MIVLDIASYYNKQKDKPPTASRILNDGQTNIT